MLFQPSPAVLAFQASERLSAHPYPISCFEVLDLVASADYVAHAYGVPRALPPGPQRVDV